MKKIFIIFLGGFFLLTTQICNAAQSPAESLNLICRAIIYTDDAELKKLGTSAENIRAQYLQIFTSSTSGVKFSDEQAGRLTDALLNAMKNKVRFSTKTLSNDNGKSKVEVTVMGIDIAPSLKNFSVTTEKENPSQEEIAELLTTAMIKKIENAKQLTPITLTFDCVYSSEIDFWYPEGEEYNLTPILDAAIGND